VSGWGIFIKDDLQKGEFIAEYRGEILNPEESDKRGYVYDRLQHTYLFGLNKGYDIFAIVNFVECMLDLSMRCN